MNIRPSAVQRLVDLQASDLKAAQRFMGTHLKRARQAENPNTDYEDTLQICVAVTTEAIEQAFEWYDEDNFNAAKEAQ